MHLQEFQLHVCQQIQYHLVPYVISIALVVFSVVLWVSLASIKATILHRPLMIFPQYFKMVRNEGLERSYNAEISAAGQKELFNDVYKDYQSTSSTTNVSTIEEFTETHNDTSKV